MSDLLCYLHHSSYFISLPGVEFDWTVGGFGSSSGGIEATSTARSYDGQDLLAEREECISWLKVGDCALLRSWPVWVRCGCCDSKSCIESVLILRFNRSIHKSGKYFSVKKRESWVLSFNSLYLEQLWLRIRLSSLHLAR